MNKSFVGFLVFFSFLLVSFSAEAQVSIDQVNKAQPGWVAGETSVSNLSKEEKQMLLGAILPEGFNDYFAPINESNEDSSLPTEFDWRNVNGTDYASPLLNQGRCGSCVAFATIYMLQTQMNITRETPFSPWSYSTQHLFTCGGGGCQTGWYPGSAISYLETTGVPDEACFPYKSGAMGEDQTCSNTCSDSGARSEKAIDSSTPTFFFVDINAIKQALLKGPLQTSYSVYDDFFYYKSGVYKHTSGEMAGGHSVTIVGWNDADRAWIVANSWGIGWGDHGYFKISWDDNDSGLGRFTYGIEVADGNGYVQFADLKDYAVFQGLVPVKITATYPNIEKLEWALHRPNSPVPVASGETRADGTATIDTSQIEDGVYHLAALAHQETGVVESQPKIVYLLNGEHSGFIKFSNVDEDQVITGKYVLEFELQSNPVPFNRVIFRAKNVETEEVILKATPNVAEKMALSWRTQKIKKGKYVLTVEGEVGEYASVTSDPVTITVE